MEVVLCFKLTQSYYFLILQNKFKKIYKELLENPEKKIVFDFCEHIRQVRDI